MYCWWRKAIKLDTCKNWGYKIHTHSLWQHKTDKHKLPIRHPLLFILLHFCYRRFLSLVGSEKEKTRNCPTPFYTVYVKIISKLVHELHRRHQICMWPPEIIVLIWYVIIQCFFCVCFLPPQVSFCFRKGRHQLHHPLRSTSASVRTGQTESPRRKSSSLSRCEGEIHVCWFHLECEDASHLFMKEGVQGRAVLPNWVLSISNDVRHRFVYNIA